LHLFPHTEATYFLLELAELFDLGTQPTAAFSAALLLPFHNFQDLTPNLPRPVLPTYTGAYRENGSSRTVLGYVDDLQYYMTLSISPRCLSSAIWSIFWEPGISCNLASAWLGAIHHTLLPILKDSDLQILAIVFAFRRPRLAPLWLGICICGSSAIAEMIQSYLTTLEESPYSRSLADPDLDIAAWTASPQSFLDEPTSYPYVGSNISVTRADLLRHRLNY
jgi:hypothetical protein